MTTVKNSGVTGSPLSPVLQSVTAIISPREALAGGARQGQAPGSVPGITGPGPAPAGPGAAQSRLPAAPALRPSGRGGARRLRAAPARPRSAVTRREAPGPGRTSRAAPAGEMGLEPLFQAWSYFRRRKFRECADVCSQLLERPPGEQVPGPRRDGRRGASRPLSPAGPCAGCSRPRGDPGSGRQRWAPPRGRPGSAAPPAPPSPRARAGSAERGRLRLLLRHAPGEPPRPARPRGWEGRAGLRCRSLPEGSGTAVRAGLFAKRTLTRPRCCRVKGRKAEMKHQLC